MTYDNNMRGVIWNAKDKKTSKHPDFTGSMEIEGVEYWLSGWKGEGNRPPVSFTIKKKEAEPKQEVDCAPANDLCDSIPF